MNFLADKNLHPPELKVLKKERNILNKHKSICIWLTGLSGSGKSTIASELEKDLFDMRISTYILDGDNIRHGLNKDLGFGEEDRKENIRRIGEVAKLFTDAGIVIICSFISPFKEDRQTVRSLFPAGDFLEVFVNCPVEVCEKRDVKGLYNKARNGEIKNFTGIDSPFEPPDNPEIEINTDKTDLTGSVAKIIEYLLNKAEIKSI
jgi:adenylylsulfate kinase